jgi:hypothetical protein
MLFVARCGSLSVVFNISSLVCYHTLLGIMGIMLLFLMVAKGGVLGGRVRGGWMNFVIVMEGVVPVHADDIDCYGIQQ